jgi:outer membrane lipoprotein-sorting protein
MVAKMATTRYCICLLMLALPACARDLTAQQVLDKVVSTYSSLKAVHMVAEGGNHLSGGPLSNRVVGIRTG